MEKEPLYLHSEYFEGVDIVTGEHTSATRLVLSSQQLRNGLIKQIGARNFAVLIAIAAHVNKENMAFPSINTIADITGIGRDTVIKSIQELTEIEVGGQHIITKSKVRASTGNLKSIYHFVNDPREPVVTEEEVTVTKTAKYYIELFCKHFEETYGFKYMPAWGRDGAMVKNKLMSTYTEDQLEKIIEIAVKDYKKFSNNPAYPTPSISALCSWLANRAAGELAKQEEQEKAFDRKIEYAEKVAELDPTALLDEL